MTKVLFLCLGNICRSPMAHAVLEDKIEQMGLKNQIIVDSAGTGDWHIGQASDPRTLATLEDNGIEDFYHPARQLREVDFVEFDYILAMDSNNLQDAQVIMNRLGSDEAKAKLRLFRDFDPVAKGSVPDPYFGGQDGFQQVFEMIDRTLDEFLKEVLKDR